MKKMISFILAAAMSAMVAVPAFAAAPTTTANGDNTWTTAGEDEAYAGKMMTMVAYSGGEITVDSIQYIDQTTADSNGAYSFANYTPKTLPTTENYNVKVGGETLTTAVEAGVIEGTGATNATVTGTVDLIAGEAKVDFVAGNEVVATTTTVSKAFTATVAPGTYDVVVSRAGYLKFTIKNVVVEADGLELKVVKLDAGDYDEDDVVGGIDIGNVVKVLTKTSADAEYTEVVDFDLDGVIGGIDVGNAVKNLTKRASVIEFSEFNK